MHPLGARLATALELTLFARSLDRTDYVGEVGLDGSREGHPTLREQRKILAYLLG
jgi:Tat protein secretion system quality control protein TatD with DNase activity